MARVLLFLSAAATPATGDLPPLSASLPGLSRDTDLNLIIIDEEIT